MNANGGGAVGPLCLDLVEATWTADDTGPFCDHRPWTPPRPLVGLTIRHGAEKDVDWKERCLARLQVMLQLWWLRLVVYHGGGVKRDGT